jgi:hypothetical protein
MQIVKLRRNRPERTPLRTLDEPVERLADGPRIGVQQEDERRPHGAQSFVARTAVAEVLTELDNSNVGEVAPHEIGRTVGRRVVDDNNIVTAIGDEGERACELYETTTIETSLIGPRSSWYSRTRRDWTHATEASQWPT